MLAVYVQYCQNAGWIREVFGEVMGSLKNLKDVGQALHMGKWRKDSSHRGNSMCKNVIESWNSMGFTQFVNWKLCKRKIVTLDEQGQIGARLWQALYVK